APSVRAAEPSVRTAEPYVPAAAPEPLPAPSRADRAPTGPEVGWLRVIEQTQQQAADAHAAFQRAMTESHLAYLRMAATTFAGLLGAAAGEPVAEVPPAGWPQPPAGLPDEPSVGLPRPTLDWPQPPAGLPDEPTTNVPSPAVGLPRPAADWPLLSAG